MGALVILFGIVAVGCGIGSLVCFILVVIQMFKNEQNGLGIACIILAFCTGVGPLIAFVYGWMKSTEWNLKKVMLAWTGCIAGALVSYVIMFAAGLGAAASMSNDFQNQLENMEIENLEVEIE